MIVLMITVMWPSSPVCGCAAIEGPDFVYVDHDTGQVSTIRGYPTHQLK